MNIVHALSRQNLPSFGLGELGAGHGFTPAPSTVEKHVVHVLLMSSPAKMVGVHAPEMTVATGMGSFVSGCRGRPVGLLAYDAANKFISAIVAHHPITGFVRAVRPENTIGFHRGKIAFYTRVLRAIAPMLQRVAVLKKTVCVLFTVPVAAVRLAAIGDRTYTGCSHTHFSKNGWSEGRQQRTNALRPLLLTQCP